MLKFDNWRRRRRKKTTCWPAALVADGFAAGKKAMKPLLIHLNQVLGYLWAECTRCPEGSSCPPRWGCPRTGRGCCWAARTWCGRQTVVPMAKKCCDIERTEELILLKRRVTSQDGVLVWNLQMRMYTRPVSQFLTVVTEVAWFLYYKLFQNPDRGRGVNKRAMAL